MAANVATAAAAAAAAAAGAEVAASKKQTPSDFLKQIIGRPVVVKLNSGEFLCAYCGVMNYDMSLACAFVDLTCVPLP